MRTIVEFKTTGPVGCTDRRDTMIIYFTQASESQRQLLAEQIVNPRHDSSLSQCRGGLVPGLPPIMRTSSVSNAIGFADNPTLELKQKYGGSFGTMYAEIVLAALLKKENHGNTEARFIQLVQTKLRDLGIDPDHLEVLQREGKATKISKAQKVPKQPRQLDWYPLIHSTRSKFPQRNRNFLSIY